MTVLGLVVLAFGAAVAARSSVICENDAEKIALGAKPDYDLKWSLLRRSGAMRVGLQAVVFGAILQMAGVLMTHSPHSLF